MRQEAAPRDHIAMRARLSNVPSRRARGLGGRYGSASEVVRAALRELEDKDKRLEALRAHLAEGAEQAARGEFVEDFNIEDVITRAKAAT